METRDPKQIPRNRTGLRISPLNARLLTEGARQLSNPSLGSAAALAESRIASAKKGVLIGHVPAPQGTQAKLPDPALIDKLGERLVFERICARLYDALISKHLSDRNSGRLPQIELLKQHRDQLVSHVRMLSVAMDRLGLDPTALTPAGDLAEVTLQGHIRVLTDPRTTFSQGLTAMLMTELADTDGWDILIALITETGWLHIADEFQMALITKLNHLEAVREWVYSLNLEHPLEVDHWMDPASYPAELNTRAGVENHNSDRESSPSVRK